MKTRELGMEFSGLLVKGRPTELQGCTQRCMKEYSPKKKKKNIHHMSMLAQGKEFLFYFYFLLKCIYSGNFFLQ